MINSSFISAGSLATLFNLLIIAAIGGLWLMWTRASRRQKKIETLLIATSEQLDEASRHLEEAMTHIQRIQNREEHASSPSENSENRAAPSSMEPRLPERSPVTCVLRMHREGYSPEDIATSQEIALARVKLMLKLHERKAA